MLLRHSRKSETSRWSLATKVTQQICIQAEPDANVQAWYEGQDRPTALYEKRLSGLSAFCDDTEAMSVVVDV